MLGILAISILAACPPDCPQVDFPNQVPTDYWQGQEWTGPMEETLNVEGKGLTGQFGSQLPTTATFNNPGSGGCWHLDVPWRLHLGSGQGQNSTLPLDLCLDEDVAASQAQDTSKPMLAAYQSQTFVTCMHWGRNTVYWVCALYAWIMFVRAEMNLFRMAVQ